MKHSLFKLGLLLAITIVPRTLLAAVSEPAPRPNIVLFLIDDMNVDSIGCFGGEAKLTPNIDRMAAEGMRFAAAHVSTTVCTPSRYSFITGRFAGRSHSKLYTSNFTGNRQGFPHFNVALEADNKNAAAVLRQAGYTTAMVGKVHVFSETDKPEFYTKGVAPIDTERRNPVKRGPEADRLFRHNHEWACRYVRSLGFDYAKHIYHGNLSKPYNEHNPEWTMEAALEFLDARKAEPTKPFFLHYCPTLTHGGGGQYADALRQLDVTGEGKIEPTPAMTNQRERFRAMLKTAGITDPDEIAIAWVDFQVGLMLDKLRDLHVDDNTLFVFAPDHGRDSKSALYTVNGTQIPLVMRWPSGIRAGQTCDALVQNIDLAPTFFDVAGVEVPTDYPIDGRSLRPLFEGRTPADWRDDVYFEIGVARAVLTDDGRKYIALRHTKDHLARIHTCGFDRLPAELSPTKALGIGVRAIDQPGFFDENQLYDLRTDPRERKNLAADPAQAELLKEMQGRLLKHLRQVGTPYGEFIPGSDTAAPGGIDEAVALARKLEVQHRTVVVPEELAKRHPERAGKTRDKAKKKRATRDDD